MSPPRAAVTEQHRLGDSQVGRPESKPSMLLGPGPTEAEGEHPQSASRLGALGSSPRHPRPAVAPRGPLPECVCVCACVCHISFLTKDPRSLHSLFKNPSRAAVALKTRLVAVTHKPSVVWPFHPSPAFWLPAAPILPGLPSAPGAARPLPLQVSALVLTGTGLGGGCLLLALLRCFRLCPFP